MSSAGSRNYGIAGSVDHEVPAKEGEGQVRIRGLRDLAKKRNMTVSRIFLNLIALFNCFDVFFFHFHSYAMCREHLRKR